MQKDHADSSKNPAENEIGRLLNALNEKRVSDMHLSFKMF